MARSDLERTFDRKFPVETPKPPVQHRRKAFPSLAEAEAWVTSKAVPAKAREHGIVEYATDPTTGATIATVTWERDRPTLDNHRYVPDPRWDGMLPILMRARRSVAVADLEPGDVIVQYGPPERAVTIVRVDDQAAYYEAADGGEGRIACTERPAYSAWYSREPAEPMPAYVEVITSARVEPALTAAAAA